MRVLITGATGQLGYELQRIRPSDVEIAALGSKDLDISDERAVQRAISQFSPHLVINAAAYTAVDRAESESEKAFAVNAKGAGLIARAAADIGARLLHISTDYVFDGHASTPYTPDSPCAPMGVYGGTKREGEERVLAALPDAVILRTAWLYSSHGANFVKTMLRLMRERDSLGVVADQIGTPTWARTLAQAVWAAAARPKVRGIHHWTDAGVASWYDFACAIQEESLAMGLLERAIAIHPLATSQYPTPARRPAYSLLDKSTAWHDLEAPILHWREALRLMLQELNFAGTGKGGRYDH